MSLSVIDKYVEKKKKDILEYAKILESLITLEENKMWSKKEEFSSNCKEIISIYANNYYFDNNIHRDNPIEYSNDNINYVLKSIIEYAKNNDKQSMLKELKNETFLLSVIICSACYLDIATNVVDGSVMNTKSKFKYLLNYLKKTKILKVYANDKIRINDLFEAIKKNNKEDKKAFEYYEIDNCFNEYKIYLTDPLSYIVDFKYNIDALKNFDEALVEKVRGTYGLKLREVSLELLRVHILKELISNREMPIFLIRLDDVINKKPNILKEFTSKYLKDYIKVLVPLEKETDYNDAIKNIKDLGLAIIYEHKETDNVKENKFTYDMEVIVDAKFLENNAENEYAWEKNGVKFVIKNKED